MAGMSGTRIAMSKRDIRRAQIMAMVGEGKRTLKEAATVLEVSYRQAKRIYARYHSEGAQGLVHRSVGRASHRRIEEATRATSLELYREKYRDFGPTLAAEKLAEHDGVVVSRETLRRWLIAADLWQPKHRSKNYRTRRERRHRFGELVQFDGSHHNWFEQRGEQCCLMNMVDDATGTTLSFLDTRETTAGAFWLLWAWIERYGIPQAVYCDRKNAFVLDREPTVDEQLAGIVPKSPFEVACEKLGIEVIVAHSPQAKGRVERNHGVYQDRFVKELRLAGIDDIATANVFLREHYIDAVNAKFAKAPRDGQDAHVPLMPKQSLANILCFEEVRVVSEDYVVQFQSRLFQLKPHKRKPMPRPGSQATVRKWLDGSIHIFTKNDTELLVEEITPKTPKHKEQRQLPA